MLTDIIKAVGGEAVRAGLFCLTFGGVDIKDEDGWMQ